MRSSRLTARAGLGAAVAAALAPTLLVASSQSAAAYVGPPKPVALPSSVLGGYTNTSGVYRSGTLDSVDAVERARRVGNTLPTDVGGSTGFPAAGLGASLAKAGSAFATATGGLQIGWTIGSYGAELMGLDSNGALQQLLGVQPAPTYVPNSDVVPSDGWVPDAVAAVKPYDTSVGGFSGSGTMTSGFTDPGIVYGSASVPALTGAVTLAGVTSTQQLGFSWWEKCADSAGGSVSYFGGQVASTTGGNGTFPASLPSGTCPAGTGFVALIAAQGQPTDTSYDQAFWYPQGSPLRPSSAPSPSRLWETRATCSDGSAVVAQSVAFLETDPSWPKVPAGKCPGTLTATHVEVWEVVPTDHSMDTQISTWDASGALQDWQTTYPQCASGTCTLELFRVNPEPQVRCFDSPDVCAQWFSSPAKATDYQCVYGGVKVALAECNVYAPTFDAQINQQTPYADPKTGAVPSTATALPKATAEAAACWPNGWDWNPLDWILTPLKCAFIPPAGTFSAGWSRVSVDWCKSGPGALSCGVSDLVAPFGQLGVTGADGGCDGLAIPIPDLLDRSRDGIIHPFSACNPIAVKVQDFWLPFSTGAVYLGSVLLGARMVARTIGAGDAVST